LSPGFASEKRLREEALGARGEGPRGRNYGGGSAALSRGPHFANFAYVERNSSAAAKECKFLVDKQFANKAYVEIGRQKIEK
jgi:hypothetical protein